jgi:hypothetical protein
MYSIFSNLSELLKQHEELLTSLQEEAKNWNNDVSIGKLFLAKVIFSAAFSDRISSTLLANTNLSYTLTIQVFQQSIIFPRDIRTLPAFFR